MAKGLSPVFEMGRECTEHSWSFIYKVSLSIRLALHRTAVVP